MIRTTLGPEPPRIALVEVWVTGIGSGRRVGRIWLGICSLRRGICMSPDLSKSPPTPSHRVAGKYLTFVLGPQAYGIPVLRVREIIRLCELTAVPNMPEHLRGVLNLRGKIIPVTDLRLKFRLAPAVDSEHTCIVVVEVLQPGGNAHALMGLIVDAVEEVVHIAGSEVEPTPDFGAAVNPAFILGMAKVKGRVKGLLDIDRVVSAVTPEQLGVPGLLPHVKPLG
ncbi:MAG: hypothetical protein RLZZ142_1111 [Verrucomicrobiota bacterium]|jgi:purine-binding chemotaxis protein CheW